MVKAICNHHVELLSEQVEVVLELRSEQTLALNLAAGLSSLLIAAEHFNSLQLHEAFLDPWRIRPAVHRCRHGRTAYLHAIAGFETDGQLAEHSCLKLWYHFTYFEDDPQH